jgi:hypothetical protein
MFLDDGLNQALVFDDFFNQKPMFSHTIYMGRAPSFASIGQKKVTKRGKIGFFDQAIIDLPVTDKLHPLRAACYLP